MTHVLAERKWMPVRAMQFDGTEQGAASIAAELGVSSFTFAEGKMTVSSGIEQLPHSSAEQGDWVVREPEHGAVWAVTKAAFERLFRIVPAPPKVLVGACPMCDEAVHKVQDADGITYWCAVGWPDNYPSEGVTEVVIDYCPFCGFDLSEELN